MNSYDYATDLATAFKIGPVYFSWYGILIIFGFLMCLLFSYLEWKKKGYDSFDFYLLVSVGGVVALFGARIWFLIFNPSDFQGFVSIFSISSGRSILGSIFFTTLWLYYYTNRHASYIESRYAFSIIFPNLLIGQAIGRWGNFFQQDVYGNIMENPGFLPSFILKGMYIKDSNGIWAYRQPLFLYESILDLLGWILITFIAKNNKKIKPGVHGGMYFVWYGATRASMELFRDDEFIMRIGKIPTSFLLSFVFIFVGIIFILYYQIYFVKANIYKEFYWKYKKIQLRKNLMACKEILKFNFKNYKNLKKINFAEYLNNKKKIKRSQIFKYKKTIKVEY